jgi:opacity protein-like surface antigen
MRRLVLAPLLLAMAVLASGARAASAQTPAGPPPPAGGSGHEGSRYHELLPDIGRIGAEVGASGGASSQPYGVDTGWEVAAFIDLPLARQGARRLSYEILMALTGGESSGRRLRVLEVSPFALKYTFTRFDRTRLRPYLTAGVDVTLAVIDTETSRLPVPDPSDAPPSGFGLRVTTNTTQLGLGGHAGAGVEVRLSRGLSLNLDYRYTRAEASQKLHAVTAGAGLHW